MKKLLTLLAGYAVGLTVAMKYRKDAGTSKLKTNAKTGKMDAFIDEVVDIHKTVYSDVKDFVVTNFDDVKDFDSLKSKVTNLVDGFALEAEERIKAMKDAGSTQKEVLADEVEDLFEKKKALLDAAKSRGATFSDVAADTLVGWIETLRSKLEGAHKSVISTLESGEEAVKKTATKAQSAIGKKSTTKKSSSK